MNIMRDAGIAAVMLLTAGGAWAQQKAPAGALPPAALKAWEAHARKSCRVAQEKYVGARFAQLRAVGEPADGLDVAAGTGKYLVADFNGDGRPDFLVLTPNGGCAGTNANAGGQLYAFEFVLSVASGFVVDESVSITMPFIDPAWLKRRGKADVLRVQTFSAGAGKCGSLPAEAVWGWTGSAMDVIERYSGKGQLVDQEGCLLRKAPATVGNKSTAVAPAKPVPPLGLATGYYAHPMECRDAFSYFVYDGKHAGVVRQDLADFVPVAALKKRGKWWSDGESGWAVSVTSPTRIVLAIGDEVPESLCPPEQVPGWAKKAR